MPVDEIKEYINAFGIFGEPVEYKELKLYPIPTKDAMKFLEAVQILTIDKNKLGDIEIIQMSYLLFMLALIQNDDELMQKFLWLIEKIFNIHRDDNLVIDEFPVDTLLVRKGEGNIDILTVNGWEIAFEIIGKKVTMFLRDVKLTSTEFDELKRLILYQNIYDYDDEPISDDVRRVVEQYYALKNKGIIPPTLEDKMMVVLSSSAMDMEQIKNMPYKQFEKLFHKIVDKTEYMVSMPLIPHLKDPNIEHWVYKKKKGKFDGIFTDADNVANKTIR